MVLADGLSLRGRAALGLLIAEAFLARGNVNVEDMQLMREGIELAWGWVEGKAIDPYNICEYIDGDINLPIRSTAYAKGSGDRDLMVSAFHSIGLVALNACNEANLDPTPSVENFGENEWGLLCQRLEKLDIEVQEDFLRSKRFIVSLGTYRVGEFGKPMFKNEIVNS